MLQEDGSPPSRAAALGQPDPQVVGKLLRLRNEGLFLQARALLDAFAPPESWTDPEAIVRGARALEYVGARRRALRLVVRLARSHLDNPFAAAAYAAELLEHRGAIFAWRWLRDRLPVGDDRSPGAAFQYLLRARVASGLRDFDACAQWIDRAEAAGCDPVDAACERTEWLDRQDLHDEALDAIAQACREAPSSHHATWIHAHLLYAAGRKNDALAVLRDAEHRFESANLAVLRASIEFATSQHAAAERSLQRALGLLPDADPAVRKQLASMMADCAYYLGDTPRAIRLGRESPSSAARRIADRLASSAGQDKRVLLDVRRVRQHRMTCAPATLTALAHWYGREADHVEIADAICYDGTRPHVERKWAQEQGWLVREFTATWQAAVQLLDARLPFALTTLDPLGGHVLAAVGYDDRRGTLLLLDPSRPGRAEAFAEGFLEAQAPYGPRAMLFVPRERAAVVEGIDLHDSAPYDELHDLNLALTEHRRDDAAAALARMQAVHAGHRLTLWAARSIALYDGDLYEAIRMSDRLLVAYPKDAQSAVIINACLRQVGARAQRTARLEASWAATGRHPAVLEQLATELVEDAREHHRAGVMVRRLIRTLPERGEALALLARIEWEGLRFDEASELMRLAACVDPMDENRAQTHFAASRALGRGEAALAFLGERARRWRARSSHPTMTLFDALEATGSVEEAFQVVGEALLARPEDGGLMLFAAVAHARYGRFGEAQALVDRARGLCAETSYHRARATVAEIRGELTEALAAWRQLAEAAPFAEDVQQAIARVLKLTEGDLAARKHARDVHDRCPHQQVLTRIWLGTLDGARPGELDEALGAAIDSDPKWAWALRERALLRAKTGRLDEARVIAALALEIEPANPAGHHTAGLVERRAGRLDQAAKSFEAAFALLADSPLSVMALIELAPSARDVRSESERLVESLIARSVDGTGIAGWYGAVAGQLAPAELKELVDRLHQSRPELWQTWSIASRHAALMGKPKRARRLAREACERFPGNTTLLLDEAHVSRIRGDQDGELAALRSALDISPEPAHVGRMADALMRAAQLDQARELVDKALQRTPMDPTVLGARARIAWFDGEQERAIELMRRSLALEPRDEDGWSILNEWLRRRGIESGALDDARHAIDARPWDPGLRLTFARMEANLGRLEAALRSAERARELDALLIDARDLQAELLASLGRKDQALAACDVEHVPCGSAYALRGRAAWVQAVFGDRAAAVDRMESLVAQWPCYAWGLHQLVGWYDEAGDGQRMLGAVERWTQAAPLDSEAHRVQGKVLMALGRLKDARAALFRATSLAPASVPALANSIDAALRDHDPDDADKWAERMERHQELLAVYWHMRIAAHRSDDDAMSAGLARLLSSPAVPQELLRDAIERVRRRWRPQDLDELVLSSHPTQAAVTAWALVCSDADMPPTPSQLRRLRAQAPDLYAPALAAVIEAVGGRGHRFQALWYAARAWPVPRTHAACWGAVSFVLLGSWLCALLPWWMKTSLDEASVRPWMLLNLALAWRALLQSERAAAVHERALKLEPDHTTPRHRLHLAFELAVHGEADRARHHLDLAELPVEAFDRAVRTLAESVLLISTSERSELRKTLRPTWSDLGRLFWEVRSSAVLSWMAWRARWMVARHTRSWSLIPGLLGDLPAIGVRLLAHPAYRPLFVVAGAAACAFWLVTVTR